MDNKDADIERVQKVVDELIEHFDSVQILVTRVETGELNGTVTLSLGAGNWYARYGQVKDWMIKIDERSRESIRNEE